MREVILLLYFICSFLFITGIFYYFVLFDKRVERRLKYYLDIDKKYKGLKKKKEKDRLESPNVKSINEFIRGRLNDESQQKIEQMLKSAGIELEAEQFIMLQMFTVVFLGLIVWLIFGNIFFVIPGGVLGYIGPKLWVNKRRQKRIQSFNDGLPDMINTIIGSLRSGYSFSQAMKTVSEECESPIKEEVTILLKEMSYGVSIEEALSSLNQRMPSADLEIMTQAILIQRQVGGNLSMILEIIVKTIRERNQLERQVQALTAQGRLSGKVIGALPVVIALGIYLINPEFMKSFFEHILGKISMAIGVILGLLGFYFINKITKIEV
jgi:tight adherence protein B